MSERPIRLMAKDAEDLAVVAACLQDAVVPLAEMRFLKEERQFVMLVNRFRWERASRAEVPNRDASFADADARGTGDERINSGLCVDRVTAVRSRGLDPEKPSRFLELITIGLDGPNKLNILFAGGGAIQLEIEMLSLFLQDFGEAWPTQWRPDHGIGAAGGGQGVNGGVNGGAIGGGTGRGSGR
jgi:hypothetical protein